MADIKLYYFPCRIRAELIRLVLVASGTKFEDIYIQMEEWPAKKGDPPFGQLPYMVYKGKKYAQSIAIANFVAREFGYYGKTNLDGLWIDEVVQLGEDLKTKLSDWYKAEDDDTKAKVVQNLKDETFPKFFGFFETLLKRNGDNGYFVGNSLTLADFNVYDCLTTALGWVPDAIAAYPGLQKLCSNVEAVPAIKSYLDSRLKYPF